ncbi:hypothetical protein [Streptomyces sp. NPDC001903]|uniref:hypothetical protein n=1 Tax=Streptomyces sp. NPDC001903 TaxID=3364622 RepID=UPI0036AD2DA4
MGELLIEMQLNDETVTVTSTLALYEWVTCDHTDLESKVATTPQQIANGGKQEFSLTAKNHETSNDYAYANFFVTHDFAEPSEPTHVTVTRTSPDRLTGLRHILIEWGDTSADEMGYQIQNIGTGRTRRVGPNRTFYEWAELGRGIQCFRVRALGNPNPSDWSSLVCT